MIQLGSNVWKSMWHCAPVHFCRRLCSASVRCLRHQACCSPQVRTCAGSRSWHTPLDFPWVQLTPWRSRIHQVRLHRPFLVGRTEVVWTRSQQFLLIQNLMSRQNNDRFHCQFRESWSIPCVKNDCSWECVSVDWIHNVTLQPRLSGQSFWSFCRR